MTEAALLFPHQLMGEHELYKHRCPIYLVEEQLFFKEFKVHKVKVAYHRASMKSHAARLSDQGLDVRYIETTSQLSSADHLIDYLAHEGVQKVTYINPTDDWLERKISTAIERHNLIAQEYENPLFINQRSDLLSFFKPSKRSFHQTTFYKNERKRLHLLLDDESNPWGGKWTYDHDNRKKYPKKN